MEIPKIHYAFIAMTIDEVDPLALDLVKNGMGDIALYLRTIKNNYGNTPDEWRPFGDIKSIKEIIEDEGNLNRYHSETILLNELNKECTNKDILYNISVFFIDPFSLFFPKYRNLAKVCDSRFCDLHVCCLLINYKLDQTLQDKLVAQFEMRWSSVFNYYQEGYLHRIAVRVNDVKNFKNYLKKRVYTKDRPDPLIITIVSRITGICDIKDLPAL